MVVKCYVFRKKYNKNWLNVKRNLIIYKFITRQLVFVLYDISKHMFSAVSFPLNWHAFIVSGCVVYCRMRFIYYLFCSNSNCAAFGVKGLQRTHSSKPLIASMHLKDSPNNTALFGHVLDSHENWLAFIFIGLAKKYCETLERLTEHLPEFFIVLNATVRLILTL